MEQLQIFNNAEFGEIRTVTINNEPWFVVSDICKALDLSNATMAMERLDEDEKSKFNLGLSGGATNCVNEYGLYTLVLASRKKEAKEFKRWITHEVLPSVRKHGMYATQELLDNPDLLIAVATELKEEREKNKALKADVLRMKPKEDFFDAVADSKTAISMNDASKVLAIPGYGRNNLFEFLRNEGILDKFNVPYQRYVDCGWFRVIEQKYTKNGEQCVSTKTLVYQKGLDAIRKRINSKTGKNIETENK